MSLIKVGDKIRMLEDDFNSTDMPSGQIAVVNFVDGTSFTVKDPDPSFPPGDWYFDICDLDVGFELVIDEREEEPYPYKTVIVNNVFSVNHIDDIVSLPEDTPARIDGHYDFFYQLSMYETNLRQLKVDPYFIAKQWRIGERDPSGVLFHILKTIARFGDKNPKEREIKAIYLQIKRLAELEGVTLEGS